MLKNYFNLIKFSHTVFALPFAMIGFFLGYKNMYPNFMLNQEIIFKLFFILLCMVSARTAAMAFNRYLDRKIDALNIRTKNREIPAGLISLNHVKIFILISCLVFIISTYFINLLCFSLSPVALFIILFYSYTKRFTPLCHLILGLGLSLSAIGAYLAITNQFNIVPILFSAVLFLWVAGFDIIYALQDYSFDKENHLYSIPSYFGIPKAIKIARFLHFLSILIVWYLFFLNQFHLLYIIGAIFYMGIIIYQYTKFDQIHLEKINPQFMTLNGVTSLIFAFFVIMDIYFY